MSQEADEELDRVISFLRKWGNGQPPGEDHRKSMLLAAAALLENRLHREPNLTATAVDARTAQIAQVLARFRGGS